MKKILMTMAAMVVAISASAQVYVGGGIGLASQKNGDADSKLHYKLVPELGYQFNKEWEAGVTVGWEGVEDGPHTFELAPYARYNFCTSKLVDLFLEGTVGYKHYSHDVDGYEFGIKPGVKVNLSDHIAFVTKVGFLGYQHRDDNGYKVKRIGLKLDGTDIQFGLNYKF